MKFRESKPFSGSAVEDLIRYVKTDLNQVLRDLFVGLSNRLTFSDNHAQFTTELTITAGSEAKVRNLLGLIPAGFIVLKNSAGMAIADGVNLWDNNFVYVRNVGGSTTTITIMFVR